MSEPKKKVRKPRRWGLRIAIFLGLLIGTLGVLFIVNIYNPLEDSVGTPLVFVPSDVDFVVNVPDLPDFLQDLRDVPMARVMKEHDGFQEFLRSDILRDNGLSEAIQNAFRHLDKLSGQMPLGLNLLGDVSGRQVVACGYLPRNPDEPLRFMLVFRPESWKVIAGVNVLLNRRLSDWGVKDALAEQGLEVEHTRDMVAIPIRSAEGEPKPAIDKLWVTRIADAILVSTEERQLAKIRKSVHQDGVPANPDPRFVGLDQILGDYPVQLLARRREADHFAGITSKLDGAWGQETRQRMEATLPRMGGSDVVAQLDFGATMSLRVEGARGEVLDGDLGGMFRPFRKYRLDEEMNRLGELLPEDVFGVLHFDMPFGDLLNHLIDTQMELQDRQLLDQGLRKLRSVRDREDLRARMNTLIGSRITLVFFRQPREPLADQAEAGVVLACSIEDSNAVHQFFESLLLELEADAESGLREAVPLGTGDDPLWKLVLAGGVIDDFRVTIPAISISDGYLFMSNYLPFLQQIADVKAGKVKSFGEHVGLKSAVAYAPQELLIAGLLDGKAIQPYLDQSAAGWAWSRTKVTQMDMVKFREEGRQMAVAQGLVPGTDAFRAAVESHKTRKQNQRTGVRRQQEEQTIRTLSSQFEGFLNGLGFYGEPSLSGVSYSVRLLPPEP